MNDDTWMASAWAGPMVSALRAMEPPNLGVVGPWCDTGDPRLLEHDMTHRTHMAVFGAHYYPPVLGAQWLDEWITGVYGGVPLAQQQPPDATPAASLLGHGKQRVSRRAAAKLNGRKARVAGTAGALSTAGGATRTAATQPAAVRPHAPFVVPSRARKLRSVVVVHDAKADQRRFQVAPLPHGRRVVEHSVVDGLDTLLQWLRRQQVLERGDGSSGQEQAAQAPLAPMVGGAGAASGVGTQPALSASGLVGRAVAPTGGELGERERGNPAPSRPTLAEQLNAAVQDLGVARHVARVHMHKRMHCGTDGLHCSATRDRVAAPAPTAAAVHVS